MKALVTGASSGIGLEIAKYLDSLGYNLILASREKEKLEALRENLKNKSKIIVIDLNDIVSVKNLYVLTKNEDIDILVNCAGFGVHGEFVKTDLNKELEMINVNIKALHILTKLYLKDMKKKNKGYILNVSSSASFYPGPLMASYYASKAYVTSLTKAISYELQKNKSQVVISCLCPGPVSTNFNKVAGVEFSSKPLDSEYVAKYAIDNMFRRKLIIIPGSKMKIAKFMARFLPDKIIMKLTYKIQKKKYTN